MSDYIDTREGWREIEADPAEGIPWKNTLVWTDDSGKQRYWLRESPVPPLPTVPYTVIRLTWRGNAETPCRAILDEDGEWTLIEQHASVSASDLAADIASWEPVSEPRAVTAKAVLDRVRTVPDAVLIADIEEDLVEIASEFKVAGS